jgi:hypothetical protein
MLACNLRKSARKGASAAQPLVDNDAQGVLVAGRAGLALELFRCHISHSTNHVTDTLARTLGKCCDAEIAEQDFVTPAQQDILWLDVAMDHLFIMCILERGGGLLDILHDKVERQWYPFGMPLAHRAFGSIGHSQKRNAVLNAKIEHPYDMRVFQVRDGTSFLKKLLVLLACQWRMEHFNGRRGA